jgi:O-antigen/teichoic acid export membrane protein
MGAVLNIVLNVLLIPKYGATGSAWATVATEVGTMALTLSTGLRKLKLRLGLGKPLKTVVLAAAMTGLMILMRPLGLIPAGLLGVLFYVIGVLLARIVDRKELALLRRGDPGAPDTGMIAVHEPTLAAGAVNPTP